MTLEDTNKIGEIFLAYALRPPRPRVSADFIRILKRHRVRFLVIGGYAMAHHG